MDSSVNTSFIPKRTVEAPMRRQGSSMSALVFLSTIIFFIAIAAFVAVFLWRASINKDIVSISNQITAVKGQIDLGSVKQLETADAKLKAASAVVASHDLITPVFKMIQDMTLQNIQYTRFSFSIDQKTKNVIVELSGRSLGGYTPIGLQSAVFAKNPDVIDNEFSNLSLDNLGRVNFSLELTINPKSLSYADAVALEAQTEAVAAAAEQQQTVPAPDSSAISADGTAAPLANQPPATN